ncbi:PREDICTED: protein GRIP [Tarenaya hassleriana]|uniref:protein GRIP n=1 Tax=Tarenaya hassleriana TaxID=28532 RepID=UPI00053C76A6|nr:PREDICTED: protein GRIP [Tarenaya hassleriana]XP_010557486.1 PREDICTED: protein GRIP [Tarenaya hassleriana]
MQVDSNPNQMSGGEQLDMDTAAEDSSVPENELPDIIVADKDNLAKENTLSLGEDHDQLWQMVAELKLENDFLKSQFKGLKNQVEEHRSHPEAMEGQAERGDSAQVKQLLERVASLDKHLDEEKQTRLAAEQALEHLREAYSEADAKAQDYAAKFSQVQQTLDREIKEREEKYAELDAKFNRLHKRAKQRIQEIQKEKDDLEARFREVNETAERASSQQSSMQQDLERTRQQANEALKAMDAERQQLRSANNKLRDTIEELRRSLQPKENTIEALQQSLLDKDQMLEDLKEQLQAAEERRQTALADLSAKHKKNTESLEAQISDALDERDKAAETVSALQVLLAEKESKIAEMEAATTGEAARLRAAAETLKGELADFKQEHEKEKETWEAACYALKTKLETAESNCMHAEIEMAKMRSQLESEMSIQIQSLTAKDAELRVAREEINHLQNEFSSYKIRAHALLQKKDTELAAARDSEQIKALEEALKEAEREISLVSAERDRARQDLQNALAEREKELEKRTAALKDARDQIKSIELKFDSAIARHQAEKRAWEEDLQVLEETWRRRCEVLTAQNEASSVEDLKKELGDVKLSNKRLKEEHDSLRELADRHIEEKDQEISRLVNENKKLQRSLEQRPLVQQYDNHHTVSQQQDAMNLSASAAEQQILLLARQQAQREEELAQTQRHILALQEEIEELERENRLHSQQEAMLKAELREMERKQKREGVDMTYLKNVILKLLETGEVEALLPVVGMLLQFSPEEMQKCQQAYHSSMDVSPASANDGSGLSLLSRFSFS